MSDLEFKAKVVHLILSGKTENALEILSKFYNVSVPKLKVGLPKGHVKKAACYVEKTKTIHVSNSDALHNPFVILHEFYHHLRTVKNFHGGIEKNADRFAKDYLYSYAVFAASLRNRER
jgi:hypothetical protein